MARIYDPTPEQEQGYRDFVASRPANVRAVAEQFDPWSLYRMSPTGQRVMVASFSEEENGTVTLKVTVQSEFNFLGGFQVFGINPANLTPCDTGDVSLMGYVPPPLVPLSRFIEHGGYIAETDSAGRIIRQLRPRPSSQLECVYCGTPFSLTVSCGCGAKRPKVRH